MIKTKSTSTIIRKHGHRTVPGLSKRQGTSCGHGLDRFLVTMVAGCHRQGHWWVCWAAALVTAGVYIEVGVWVDVVVQTTTFMTRGFVFQDNGT